MKGKRSGQTSYQTNCIERDQSLVRRRDHDLLLAGGVQACSACPDEIGPKRVTTALRAGDVASTTTNEQRRTQKSPIWIRTRSTESLHVTSTGSTCTTSNPGSSRCRAAAAAAAWSMLFWDFLANGKHSLYYASAFAPLQHLKSCSRLMHVFPLIARWPCHCVLYSYRIVLYYTIQNVFAIYAHMPLYVSQQDDNFDTDKAQGFLGNALTSILPAVASCLPKPYLYCNFRV